MNRYATNSFRLRLTILIIAIISAASCTISSNTVCEKARKYSAETEINNIVEYFTVCQYRTPADFDELCDFVNEWKRNDSDGFSYNDEIIQSFFAGRQMMASFKDSVLIFFPKRKIGCCVYGTPFYWLEHPDRYPAERMDYNSYFEPSAFNDDNEYLFQIDYSSFKDSVDKFKSAHEYELIFKRPDCQFDFYYPLRAIITIDLNGEGSTVIYQNAAAVYIRPISEKKKIDQYNGAIQTDLEQYISDVIDLTKTFFSEKEGASKVIVPIELRL